MWFDPDAAPGWHDWVGIVLAIVGLVLTVVGFAIAWIQLRKTQTATEAATQKLAEARQKLNGDQLAAALPQLASVVSDLDFAINSNDREVAHRALLRFSFVANESVALLAILETDNSDLERRLLAAAQTALDVKGSIVSKKGVDIARTAKSIGNEITSLSVELSGMVAKDRYQIGDLPSV